MKYPVRRSFLLGCACATLLLSFSCSDVNAWQPPRPVTVRGGELWYTPMPSWISWVTVAAEDEGVGVLIRDGEILCGSESFLEYRSADGDVLEVSESAEGLSLGGKMVSLLLDEDAAGGWEWIEKATADELRALRVLQLPDSMEENRVPLLKKIAAVNPGVMLRINSTAGLAAAAPLFTPKTIFISTTLPLREIGGLLADETQVETLMLPGSDGGPMDFLARMPKLRRLAIFNWNPSKTGPIPAGLNALETLVIAQSIIEDTAVLADVNKDLRELSLTGCGELADTSGFARFTELRTLILNSSPVIADLSAFRGMKKLERAGLPPNTSQEELSEFVAEHRNLKILEMVACEKIQDFSPIAGLKELTGLVVTESNGNLDAVKGMKSLAFFGVPGNLYDQDPKILGEFRAALPKALVVPAMPLCLGSGWLLAVFPLAGAIWLARTQVRRSKRPLSRE
jgi:hypothetical protein